MGFQQVAAQRRAVRLAEDHVRMNLGLPALSLRNVADQRNDLDLLADGNPLVVLLRPVEVAERHVLEGADGSEVTATELMVAGERLEVTHDLVASLEDQGVRLLAIGFVE